MGSSKELIAKAKSASLSNPMFDIHAKFAAWTPNIALVDLAN
jgi:hypothetical protein